MHPSWLSHLQTGRTVLRQGDTSPSTPSFPIARDSTRSAPVYTMSI
jgi:hypothetical protein